MTNPAPVRVGTMISEFAHPNIIAINTRIGYQFAILDREHGAFDLSEVTGLAAASGPRDVDLYVRIPEVGKAHIGPVLDAGADGIIAPMVSTAAQARELVRLAKYPPIGERGISLTRAHSGYRVSSVVDYTEAANQRVRVYAQIETLEALAAVEEIAAVPGLDGLIVGPNDLLQSMGVPGQSDHPGLAEAMDVIAAAAAGVGIESGVISSHAGLLARGARAGMRFLSMDSDVGNLIRGGLSSLAALQAALED